MLVLESMFLFSFFYVFFSSGYSHMALLSTINACGYINFLFYFLIVCEIWTDLFYVVFMKFGVVDEMMKWVLILRIDLSVSFSY